MFFCSIISNSIKNSAPGEVLKGEHTGSQVLSDPYKGTTKVKFNKGSIVAFYFCVLTHDILSLFDWDAALFHCKLSRQNKEEN